MRKLRSVFGYLQVLLGQINASMVTTTNRKKKRISKLVLHASCAHLSMPVHKDSVHVQPLNFRKDFVKTQGKKVHIFHAVEDRNALSLAFIVFFV